MAGSAAAVLHAAAAGDATLVETLLQVPDGDATHDSLERSHCAALFIASQSGHAAVVGVLLAHGVSCNMAARNGATPLYVAARNGHLDVVRQLLPSTSSELMGPAVVVAAHQGHAACVQLLAEARAQVDFAPDNQPTPALWVASQSGKTEAVRQLLLASADANRLAADGTSPLLVACQQGRTAIVKMLLAARANVDLVLENGRSPLSVACHRAVQTRLSSSLRGEDGDASCGYSQEDEEDDTRLPKMLLVAGAPVASGESGDLTRGGLAALTLACSRKDHEMLGLLQTHSAGHANAEQTILDIWEMTVGEEALNAEVVGENDSGSSTDSQDSDIEGIACNPRGADGCEVALEGKAVSAAARQGMAADGTECSDLAATTAVAERSAQELRRQRQRLKEKVRKAQQQRRRQLAASRAELRLAHGRARGEAAEALRAAIALHALTCAQGRDALKEALDAAEKIVMELSEAALQGMRSETMIAQARARLFALEQEEGTARDGRMPSDGGGLENTGAEAADHEEMDDATFEELRREMEALRQGAGAASREPSSRQGTQVIKTLCEKLSQKLDESIRRQASGSYEHLAAPTSAMVACEVATSADDSSCCVCMAAPRNASLVHGETAHICCCIECARTLKARGNSCPICNETIDAVLRNFVS
ncbi:hypothetical protein AB1Y20_020271 [Prymnesium parvum]|uniref:RING-type E3 ubiquitin transferase n=1 Tax=Prymnesium parvum TaxID=97485 RepID=A0AB34JWF7_PRYPA